MRHSVSRALLQVLSGFGAERKVGIQMSEQLTSKQVLAPCPNCLDAVDVQISTNHMVHWVSCVCGVSGPTSVSREVAVEAWNEIFGARP